MRFCKMQCKKSLGGLWDFVRGDNGYGGVGG